MMDVPSMIIRLRPRGLLMKMVMTAPKKHPKLYEATEIPRQLFQHELIPKPWAKRRDLNKP